MYSKICKYIPVIILIISSIVAISSCGYLISKDSQGTESIPNRPVYTEVNTKTVISTTIHDGNPLAKKDASPLTLNVSATVITVPAVESTSSKKNDSHKYGGTLKLISRQPFLHQDVHLERSPSLSTWGPGIVYNRLLKYESNHDLYTSSSSVLVCDLCENWIMESDRTFLFKLRSDVKWQDVRPTYGRKLSAEDIQYSYNRQRQGGWANSKMFSSISDIHIDENESIRINLRFTDADLLNSIADARSKIISPESVQLNGDLKNGPSVGTGPWIFNTLENEDVYKFERNVNYFENELPYVDRLLINVIKDPESRIAAFKVKLIDVKEREQLSIDQPSTEAGLSKANSISIYERGLGMSLSLNSRRYPFNNLKAREATFLAMDPWSAAKDVWLDTAYVSLGLPSTQMEWLLKEKELRKFFNQPDRARDVIRSEYPQSLIPVTISVGDFGDMYLRHAEYISNELKYIGFDTAIQIIDRRTYGEDVWLKGNYSIALGPVPPVNSLNRYLIPLLHSKGVWNSTSHNDKYLDGLLEAQSKELDLRSRKELLVEIQRVVLRKAIRYMPATKVTVWMWLPRVQNFSPTFEGYGYSHWAELWLQDRK